MLLFTSDRGRKNVSVKTPNSSSCTGPPEPAARTLQATVDELDMRFRFLDNRVS
jgi:hypothetical protein